METVNNVTPNTVPPQELYHAVWRTARACFYERSRLADWDSWEHRFDAELHSEEDAYRCIDTMLASLKDTYTFLKRPDLVTHDASTLASAPPPAFSQQWKEGIGYIRINTFMHNKLVADLRAAVHAVRHSRAFIIDLRGNGGGFLDAANNAISLFMDEGPVMVNRTWSNGAYQHRVGRLLPNTYQWDAYNADGDRVAGDRCERQPNLAANKPIVVLIDRGTASASELFSGILRDNKRVTLVGADSAGKGIAQNTFPIANGCDLKITDGLFLSPTGQWYGDHDQTVRNPIVPHIRVEPDPNYRGDQIADVAFDRLVRHLGPLQPSNSGGGVALVGAAAILGIAYLLGGSRGGNRAA